MLKITFYNLIFVFFHELTSNSKNVSKTILECVINNIGSTNLVLTSGTPNTLFIRCESQYIPNFRSVLFVQFFTIRLFNDMFFMPQLQTTYHIIFVKERVYCNWIVVQMYIKDFHLIYTFVISIFKFLVLQIT